MLAKNKYTAFEYVGDDIKRVVLDSKILSIKVRLKDTGDCYIGYDSKFNYMNDERIANIAKREAIIKLSEDILNGLDVYIDRSVEYGTVNAIFSIRVLEDVREEKYLSEIENLKRKLKKYSDEMDYVDNLKYELSVAIKDAKEIRKLERDFECEFKRSLKGLSFWERLWFTFTGRVYLLENFKEDN